MTHAPLIGPVCPNAQEFSIPHFTRGSRGRQMSLYCAVLNRSAGVSFTSELTSILSNVHLTILMQCPSGLKYGMNNAMNKFNLLVSAFIEQRIYSSAQTVLILFAIKAKKKMWRNAERFRHRKDCVQAGHLFASFHLAPIVGAQMCFLGCVLESELCHFSQLPNPFSEQLSVVHASWPPRDKNTGRLCRLTHSIECIISDADIYRECNPLVVELSAEMTALKRTRERF